MAVFNDSRLPYQHNRRSKGEGWLPIPARRRLSTLHQGYFARAPNLLQDLVEQIRLLEGELWTISSTRFH